MERLFSRFTYILQVVCCHFSSVGLCSSTPEKAHYLCSDFPSAVQLASQGALADLVETIWILGGTSVYRVRVVVSFLFTEFFFSLQTKNGR